MSGPSGTDDLGGASAGKKLGFISYAHDDHALFEEFRQHLNIVSLAFPAVACQADPSVHGGQLWQDEVLRMIRRSRH